MQIGARGASRVQPTGWLERLRYEVVLNWKFIQYDISTTIIPGVLFVLAAWHDANPTMTALPGVLLSGLLYFWLYCCVFCISNQLGGEIEDRVNKPGRPLVTGLVSRKGAWARWAVCMVLFDLVGWYLGVLEWAILWQLVLTFYNLGSWAKHWWTKNVVMAVGLTAQLAAAWQMVRPITPTAWAWIAVPAIIMLSHVSLQDMRDIAGDRANGRRTFPIIHGETPTRIFLAICFAALPLATHYVLMEPAGPGLHVVICDALLTLISLVIAVRLLLFTTPQAHHRTYMLFTYWYCFTLASAIVVL